MSGNPKAKQLSWYPESPKQIKLSFFIVVALVIPRITATFRLEKTIILFCFGWYNFRRDIFGAMRDKSTANALCIGERFNKAMLQKYTPKTAPDTKIIA